MKIEDLTEAKRIKTGNGFILSNVRKSNVKAMMDQWTNGIRGASDASGVDCANGFHFYHGNIINTTGNSGDVLFCAAPNKKELRNMDHGNTVIFEMLEFGWLIEIVRVRTEDDLIMRNMMINVTNTFGRLKLLEARRNQLTRAFDEMSKGDTLG